MFKKNQVVYTARKIIGWFDKSTTSYIPMNSPCIINKIFIGLNNNEEYDYNVTFIDSASEFGSFTLNEKDLKECQK